MVRWSGQASLLTAARLRSLTKPVDVTVKQMQGKEHKSTGPQGNQGL